VGAQELRTVVSDGFHAAMSRGENHRKQPSEVLDGGLYGQVPSPQRHLKDPNTVALWHELNHLVGILRTLEAMTLP
jgi:hypothetical protein